MKYPLHEKDFHSILVEVKALRASVDTYRNNDLMKIVEGKLDQIDDLVEQTEGGELTQPLFVYIERARSLVNSARELARVVDPTLS